MEVTTVCNVTLLCALQIGASLKFNSNNLQTLREAGGFSRITQLLQWTAFTFHPADTIGSDKPHTAIAPHSPKPHGRATAVPSSPRLGLKSLTLRSRHTQPTSGPIHTRVLRVWCEAVLQYKAIAHVVG